jgi:uncharacterized membrane protein
MAVQQSGPLPPAAEFEGYERTSPGAASRILAMAEQDAEHLRDMERRAQPTASRQALIAQLSAVAVPLIGVVVGYLLAERAPWVAGVIAGGALSAPLVAAFLRHR